MLYFKKEGLMIFSTIDISFPEDLLLQIDQIAKDESQTREVLVRNAVRMYYRKKK